jgi:CubicO group peptidase (beta-lactamase class C family)
MISDQTARMPGLPDAEKLASRWGLGFALGSSWFGDLVSPSTFGHIGATGSLFWADPTTGLSCVLLTNQPRLWRRPAAGFELLGPRFSNAVAAAVTR